MAKRRKPLNVTIPVFNIEEVSLLAIKTEEEDYQLAYRLNTLFKFALYREVNFAYYEKNENKEYFFSLFFYYDEKYKVYYFLIKTENEERKLHYLFEHASYILLVIGSDHSKIAEDIKQRSINISDVFCCEHIDFLDSDSVRKPFLPKLTGKQYKKEMKDFMSDILSEENIQYFFETVLIGKNKEDKAKEDKTKNEFFQFW